SSLIPPPPRSTLFPYTTLFRSAIEALPQFRGQTDREFAAWLRRILANKLADQAKHFHRKKRDAALEDSFRETLDDSARRLEQIRSEEHTSELQSRFDLVCRLLL